MDDAPQLRMVWPAARLDSVPEPQPLADYTTRNYRPGDEARFHELMERAGWPGWDGERLSYSLNRILPDGWFMAVHSKSAVIVVAVSGPNSVDTVHSKEAQPVESTQWSTL